MINEAELMKKWLPVIERRGAKCIAANSAMVIMPRLIELGDTAYLLLAAIMLETFETGKKVSSALQS